MKKVIFAAVLVAAFINTNVVKADEFEELFQQMESNQQDAGNIARSEEKTEVTSQDDDLLLIDAASLDTVSEVKSTKKTTSRSESDSDFELNVTDEGQASLDEFRERSLEDMRFTQYYQDEDGTVVKSAQSEGWGVECGLGYSYMWGNAWSNGAHSPMFEIAPRYDGRWISFRTEIGLLMRKRHNEDLKPEDPYLSFYTDLAFHVNLWNDQEPFNAGFNNHVISLYGSVGYMYDQHRSEVGVLVDEEKNLYEAIEEHRASGVTYGFGLEYQWRIHAMGNALILRVGAKNVPQSFVGHTESQWQLEAKLAVNIGIKRNRYSGN